MGEKAATNEVISQLVSALGDKSKFVRRYACKAVGKMGEKAAMTEVISQLVRALEDESEDVRKNACEAVGKMGEKAATKEVISRVVSALVDKSEDVRTYACEALGEMGEKAATNEVISQLLTALGDQNEDVRKCACEALEKMGEKAATKEVIRKLVTVVISDRHSVSDKAVSAMGHILSSSVILTGLDPLMISKLCRYGGAGGALKNITVDQLINVFFITKNRHWLSIVFCVALEKGVAVTVDGEKVRVYDGNEPVELPIPCVELCQQIIKAFNNEARRLRLSFEIASEAESKCLIS